MKTKTVLLLLFIGGLVSFFIYINNTVSDAEKWDVIQNNRNELLQNWYSKNNPTNDPNGRQPSEEDLRQIRMASRVGKKEIPSPESTPNKTPSNKPYSSAELFFNKKNENNFATAQDTFKSVKYNYSIVIPENFHRKQTKGKHIDFCFNNDTFCTIVANISQKMTVDPPINEALLVPYEQSLKQMNPTLEFLKSSIIIIDNNNVMVSLQRDKNKGIWLNSIEYYFYHNNEVYIITASAPEEKFSEYETIFLKTINSFKFN
jgi:hypothetical protein